MVAAGEVLKLDIWSIALTNQSTKSAWLLSTLSSSLLVHCCFLMKKYWGESCKSQDCVSAMWQSAWTVKMRKGARGETVVGKVGKKAHGFRAGEITFYLLNWKTFLRIYVGGSVEEWWQTVQNTETWKCSAEVAYLPHRQVMAEERNSVALHINIITW